ncbi:hypothetical protein IEQ34_021305 [Dendrobium chrysotoxum]|uniref:Uncharacterized protein n=1 Tax=Dendrobium chrysotoxum TaxID=161865 RepID=A0AAV7G4K3_DENCH|nr:hypothetical protein IEQ34_021305 [Dendrobium chrysotoxum]
MKEQWKPESQGNHQSQKSCCATKYLIYYSQLHFYEVFQGIHFSFLQMCFYYGLSFLVLLLRTHSNVFIATNQQMDGSALVGHIVVGPIRRTLAELAKLLRQPTKQPSTL